MLHGGALPVDPVDQNRAWYRLYKTMENDPPVRQVHKDFLLLRDYTGLCAVFIVLFGAAGLHAIASAKVGQFYLLGADRPIRGGAACRGQLQCPHGDDRARQAGCEGSAGDQRPQKKDEQQGRSGCAKRTEKVKYGKHRSHRRRCTVAFSQRNPRHGWPHIGRL